MDVYDKSTAGAASGRPVCWPRGPERLFQAPVISEGVTSALDEIHGAQCQPLTAPDKSSPVCAGGQEPPPLSLPAEVRPPLCGQLGQQAPRGFLGTREFMQICSKEGQAKGSR